jgi:ribonuclease G
MSKEIYISSTPHETRLAIVEDDGLTEIYYERENEYTLAGSIYNGRVTRVLPGMQSSFVDIGLERDAFLYITDFMEEAGDSADFEAEGSQRNSRREPVTLEGNANGERSERPERTERPERERGGRGRRRERGGNRDRQPSGEPAAPQPEEERVAEDGYSDEPLNIPIDSEEGSAESLGEGAPGADGSRRWRGRRGRRRGRSRGQEDQNTTAQGSDVESSDAPIDLDAVAEEHQHAEAPEIGSGVNEYPQPEASAPREERGGRESRGRGGRERGERGERGGRRAPRGFAPRTASYGIENQGGDEGSAQGDAPSEPIVLPGESLSKYRKDADGSLSETKAAAPIAAAPVAPGYEIPSGWDGGFVLPGESLSRRRRSESAPVERVAPVAAPVREAIAERLEVVEETFEVSVETPEAIEEIIVAVSVERSEEPTEYEPTEASASYRFDPVAPSEFRQSAPEEEVVEEAVEYEPILEHSELPHAEIEQIEQFELAEDSVESEPTQHHEAVSEEPRASHEITSIHASGEMISPTPVIDEVEAEAEHQAFEAGDEMIEEDELDESALDPDTLFASSIEELDDFDDEETLEGAADLGTMIRDMSIDQITYASLEDEEDDFEEEDAVDDARFETAGAEYAAAETDELEEEEDEDAEEGEPSVAEGTTAPQERSRDLERRRGRRDRRGGGRDRGRHSGGDRDRNGGRGRSRSSMQATDLPAITELLKPGQEILVQIAKEPIAKKGARITSHIALPGRFLVFMPTVNHTGVSRKIESDSERRRLKEILLSEKGDAAGGFIVRTAASGASEEELRSDLRFLLHLWADIKQRSESSKSPALIYHDLNLVERILRDQVTDTFSAIWVDTESEYERVLRFLQRFQPSLIRRVKLYTKETPLFEQFGITEEINKALRSKVWLKSGGSIVINQTEALVAIDINTGKYVGKTARLEDTIVKTNLDAIPEIVRQIRLRDLGGIIIIDFIDMDERKNRNRVMAALEDELKSDRAPSKILQFNDFGLVAITRKRVKQSLERTLSTQCSICAGTGMVKSPVTVCNDIYVEMRKMSKHLDRGDVMLRVHPDVVKQLKSSTKWLQEMEEIAGKTILVKSDPSLHPEQFDIH